MQNTKRLAWLIAAFLIVSVAYSLYGVFLSGALSTGDYSVVLPAIITLLLELGFLWAVYRFISHKNEQNTLIENLNKPAAYFLKMKLPWWLIVYAVVLLAIIIYTDTLP